jgi:hypothetical protein
MYYVKPKNNNNNSYGQKQLIEIFNKQTHQKVGEFERNYHGFGESTFAPFKRDEQWYAIYSPSYVALSVMKLPECTYLGGEDQDNPHGFCPVEVIVPKFQWAVNKATPESELDQYPEQNHHWLLRERYEKLYDSELWEPDQPVFHENFALVAGCYFGNDWAWEIQMRDISSAHLGVIRTIKEFPYCVLPRKVDLKNAIELSVFEQYDKSDKNAININLTIHKCVRLDNTKEDRPWAICDMDKDEDVKRMLCKK